MRVRRKIVQIIRLSITRRMVGTVALAALLLGAAPPIKAAQFISNIGHGPNINVGPRITPNIAPRVDIRPNVRFSPNITYQDPTVRGEQPRRVTRKRMPPDDSETPSRKAKKRDPQTAADNTYVLKEVLIEIDGNPGEDQVAALARRFRLTRAESQNLPELNSTFYRWRIADDRPVDDVVRELNASGNVKSAQRNSIFRLQESQADAQKPLQQYALDSLRLPEAHALSRGADVRVAVIDSGIDVSHPEIAGAVESSFDALGGSEGPHPHGTGIAGIIAAHQRLTGAAPSARIIAIRAFGAQKAGTQSTSFVVLKSLDYAIAHNAQIINMSFAGPRDAAIERGLGIAAAKGITLVAAAGNAGPKSPPLYPGADHNVIAVTATDSSDHLFPQANCGGYVAIAAPGVDVLTAQPDEKYGV